ncbi:hypothetical protein [Sphingomonas sp. VNH70]|uniref:hypothetical protein n=1 Tax=Sphingomonas silueang TaxID=3156617 RepID=UPI0032B418D8
MTDGADTAHDRETAKRAGKASVRDAIGKLIGDDTAGTPPGGGADTDKDPPRR